jgi:hypothetical protein
MVNNLMLYANNFINVKINDRFFALKVNLYILIVFIALYYTLVPPKDMFFSNQDNEVYQAKFLDYVYMAVIIHGTVGLGDVSMKSDTGKILKILHTFCILGFNILLFN